MYPRSCRTLFACTGRQGRIYKADAFNTSESGTSDTPSGEVAELLYDTKITDEMKDQKIICGVRMYSGAVYHAKAVILCTGTYLKARCIYGDVVNYTGPNGLSAANHLSDSMRDAGIFIRRFKTGTPARLDKKTIDFTKMQEQKVMSISFHFPLRIKRKISSGIRFPAG